MRDKGEERLYVLSAVSLAKCIGFSACDAQDVMNIYQKGARGGKKDDGGKELNILERGKLI